MSYYKERLKAYRSMDSLVSKHKSLNLNSLLLDLTSKFEISEKSIYNRLELLQKVGRISLVNETIKRLD